MKSKTIVGVALVVLLASASAATRAGAAEPEAPPPALAQLRLLLQTVEQPVVEGAPVRLDDVIREALDRNPRLLALKAQHEASRHRPAQELFLQPPSFEAQIWQWPLDTLNPWNTDMYMFTASQDLPGRGKRRLRAAVAEKDIELAGNAVAVEARGVIDQVKRVYADLFLARKAIDIHLASVDLMRQFADISHARYVSGGISQQDVLKAVVELSKLHDDIVVLTERAEIAEARLNTLLDYPPDRPIGPLVEPRERELLPAAAELQRLAVERQPELQTMRLEIERAEAALAATEREYKPDFFVGGGYFLMPRRTDSWTLRAGITWPRAPWSRGRLDAAVAERTAEITAARARLRAAENDVRYSVQEAYVRVKTAAHRAQLLRTSITPQSQQALEVSRAAYQTDRVDFLVLIDNQRVLLTVELDYYQALNDLEQGLADLERAVGTDLTPAMLAAAVDPGREE